MSEVGSRKRLKRGLEDLSPLFQSSAASEIPEKVAFLPNLFDVQFVSVSVPDHEGDTLIANAALASHLVRQTHLQASLISIAPGANLFPQESRRPLPSLDPLDPRISRVHLSHQQLWSLTQNGPKGDSVSSLARSEQEKGGRFIFLEFEPSRFQTLSRIALLLDRVILSPEPRVESLQETYRLMKILWNLNREIEFFLLFRGAGASESHEEFLFERFSLATSRFLGTTVGWLGSFNFPSRENFRFHPEPILALEGLPRPLAPEKSRLWHALQEKFPGKFFPEWTESPLEEVSPFTHPLSREELREFIEFGLDTVSSKYKS